MEKRNIQSILSLLLILFLAGCSFPTSTPTQPQPTQTTATEPATEATAASAAGAGLCANAYYPVRQGATWNYKSTGSPAGAYSFTDTIASVRDDGFTLTTQSGNMTFLQAWACKPEGLVALQFGGAPAALLNAQGMQLEVQASNVNGVTFPSQIKPSDQWQHSLEIAGNATASGIQGTAKGNA